MAYMIQHNLAWKQPPVTEIIFGSAPRFVVGLPLERTEIGNWPLYGLEL